jgi:3-hydroxy-9,10-secoandrosta-1,3,5(10)-triene-9,17-dione monooxygenase reductase component
LIVEVLLAVGRLETSAMLEKPYLPAVVMSLSWRARAYRDRSVSRITGERGPPNCARCRSKGDRFRRLLGQFATGVTVVTSLDRGTGGSAIPWGTTVNAFSSVSLDPPLVMIAIGHVRSIHPIILRERVFAVNVLAEDAQAISDCFAGAGDVSRAELCGALHHAGALGMPILDDAIAVSRVPARGGARGRRPLALHRSGRGRRGPPSSGSPAVYFRGRYLRIERRQRGAPRKPET